MWGAGELGRRAEGERNDNPEAGWNSGRFAEPASALREKIIINNGFGLCVGTRVRVEYNYGYTRTYVHAYTCTVCIVVCIVLICILARTKTLL